MSIKNFAVSETARLPLRDSADSPMYAENGSEMAVTVYGPGSKQYAAAQTKQSNRLMNRLRSGKKVDQSPEDKLKEQAEFLADITHSFENVDLDGLTGRALAMAIYTDQSLGFVSDQVAKFTGDWANFSKPSATN